MSDKFDPDTNSVTIGSQESQPLFGGNIRNAAAGADNLVADVQKIVDELRNETLGVTLTVGPFDLFGITVPAVPLTFKLSKLLKP